MSNECGCECYCEAHDRDCIAVDPDGVEYCMECVADGFSGELVWPYPDSCHSKNGIPDEFDIEEMNFMCEKHKQEKIKFIKEVFDEG